ncbi:MAG: T9SS type A sorting domain-containing protein [Bacteroidia bacterium]
MKKGFSTNRLIKALLVVGLVFVVQQVISYTNNPPVRTTGAPNEGNCTSCHTGTAITSGTNYNDLEITTNMSNDEYLPDSVYDITISYSESGRSKFGFMATVLETTNDTKSGDITITNSTRTAKSSANIGGNSREYVYHRGSGTSGTGTISWDFEWKAPAINQGDVKFYVALNSTNNNNSDGGDKIILKEFEFEPSKDLPTASITTNESSICIGDTLLIDGSKSKNAQSFSWIVNGQAWTNNNKDSIIKAVWSKSGTFNIRLTTSNNLGNSIEERLRITVLESPADTISILGNDTICAGDTTTLTATSGAKSYLWSNNSTSQAIEVTKSGTYYAVIESSNGCKSKTKEIDINVVSKPQLSIGFIGNDTICEVDSVRLFATTNLSNYTYKSAGAVLLNTNKDSSELKVAPGEYAITATAQSKQGCISEPSNTIKLVVAPQIIAPTISCANVGIEKLTAQWQETPNILDYEISLDSGHTWLNINGTNSHTVNGLSFSKKVSFWLRGKTAGQCDYTTISTKECKTQSCFNVSYDLVNNSACTNQQQGVVEFNNLNLANYSISFNGEAESSNSTFIYSVGDFSLGENIVNVSFIDSNALSCPAFDTTLIISVKQAPSPKVLTEWGQVDGENRICLNAAPKVLEGNDVEGGIPYADRQWTGNGVRLLTGNSFEFDPNAAGAAKHVLEYTVTSINGCTAFAYDTIIVDSTKEVSFTFSADQRLVSFNTAIKGTTEVTWDFGDGNMSNKLNPTHYYGTDGTYTVVLKTTDSSNVCDQVSFTDDVSVIGGSIGERSIQLEAFPNPFSEEINLKFNKQGDYQIELLNANGAVVYNSIVNATNYSIKTSYLSRGVYLLRVSTKNRIYKSIIVK